MLYSHLVSPFDHRKLCLLDVFSMNIGLVIICRPEKVTEFFVKMTTELQPHQEWKDWFGMSPLYISSKGLTYVHHQLYIFIFLQVYLICISPLYIRHSLLTTKASATTPAQQ